MGLPKGVFMKKLSILLGGCFLVLAFSVAANASEIWIGSVGTSSGWLDVNKNWSGDWNLCWAASASDILAYTGWIGAPSLSTESQIFNDFKAHWSDDWGNPNVGIDWWFGGVNSEDGSAGWAQIDDGMEAPAWSGFYSPALFSANAHSTFTNSLTDIGTYLNSSWATSVRIATYDNNGNQLGAHFITAWGVDPASNKLWATDSDDNLTQLAQFDWSAGGYLSGAYADWKITSIYALGMNSQNVTPTARNGNNAIPEPSTFLLLVSGMIAVVVWNRKK
jgi:hypothetical protein